MLGVVLTTTLYYTLPISLVVFLLIGSYLLSVLKSPPFFSLTDALLAPGSYTIRLASVPIKFFQCFDLSTLVTSLSASHQKIPFAGYAQQRGCVLQSLLGRLDRPHALEALARLSGLCRFSLGNYSTKVLRSANVI
jgi:hypothetical protein